MEKQCKWHFANRDANDQYSGPNNPTTENFNGNGGQIRSLIREVIQNSLDARKSFTEPVTVKFDFCSLPTKDFPELLNLNGTLEACRNFYPDDKQVQDVYTGMLSTLNRLKTKSAVDCLRIQDFGTKGMDYVPVEIDTTHNNKFLAFMRSLGVHSQQEHGRGGSFGFGKAAYFGLSPLATVLTSTCSVGKDGEYNYYFEGTTWLSTHYYAVDGVKQFKSHVGYYDNNNGEPISGLNNIPEFFHRNSGETGTTFYILGAEGGDMATRKGIYEQMFVSVLENFWLAIYRNELTVEIGGTEGYRLNKENLEANINRAIRNGLTFSKDRNPKPFLESILGNGVHLHKSHDLGELGFKEAEGKSYGTLEIFITKDQNGVNKFQRQRRLLMAVENKRGTTRDGYNGVTLISEGYGNDLLQKSEPPAHDKWDYTRLQTRSLARKEAKELLDKISELEQAAVAELFNHAARARDYVKDIHEYCAIIDERSKREECEGDLEGSKITTEKQNEHIVSKNTQGEGIVLSTITSTSNPEKGGPLSGGYPDRTKKNTERASGRKSPANTDRTYAPATNGKEKRLYDPKKVKVHCAVTKDSKGEYVHELLVTCKEETIKDASIIVTVEGAGGSQSLGIKEIYEGNGKVNSTYSNMIEGVRLNHGLNRIKIKFNDSSKKFAITLSIKH